MNNHDLSESDCGCHIKVRTLLEDPEIKAELQSYIQSNKWVLSLLKLQDFTNNKLLPAEAAKYCQQLCDKEMLLGLKKYMELELFPCFHMKVGKGISVSMA